MISVFFAAILMRLSCDTSSLPHTYFDFPPKKPTENLRIRQAKVFLPLTLLLLGERVPSVAKKQYNMKKELFYYSVFAISQGGIVSKMDRQISISISIKVNETETPDEIQKAIITEICEKMNRNTPLNLYPDNIEIKLLSLIEMRMLN